MGAYKLLLVVNFFKKKIRNTTGLLANFASLARYSLIILGWLVLPGAQAAQVQKEGDIYYEYIDPVVTP